MSSQLVDIDADGYNDILVGSFCGVPQIIKGNVDGYGTPQNILDGAGQTVLIADFWNYDEEIWDSTDRAGSEGHCTSISAVDWDDDGDLDLILGDYYGGRLVLRLNEGTAEEPKFATTNQPIMAAGEPIIIDQGLAAPRIVDWNDDGKFDILCGGAKGGVYLFVNEGQAGTPEFARSETIIDQVVDPSNSYVRQVPARDGEPLLPGSSYHIEPTDYDGDGDLDLLVGARSSWVASPQDEMSEEEKKRLTEVTAELQSTTDELVAMAEQATTNEERQALVENQEYLDIVARYQELSQLKMQLDPNVAEMGDFVWVYLRK